MSKAEKRVVEGECKLAILRRVCKIYGAEVDTGASDVTIHIKTSGPASRSTLDGLVKAIYPDGRLLWHDSTLEVG